MTSVRKRKMARSSVSKNTRRTKDKQRKVKIYSNPIIEANWDHSLTLQQNYKKLGLTAKLGHIAGGQERKIVKWSETTVSQPSAIVEDTQDPAKIPKGEARIIRDDKGEVVKVIYGTMDPQPTSASETKSEIIEALEQQALKNASIVKTRHQSEREVDWIKSLYEKYGDDYDKMKWDKLNIYQQSPGDLKRRIAKWKKSRV